jgi:hypothetical protein
LPLFLKTEGTGAFASDYQAEQKPCKAFDDNDDPDSQKDGGDFWQTNTNSQAGAYIGWDFGSKKKVRCSWGYDSLCSRVPLDTTPRLLELARIQKNLYKILLGFASLTVTNTVLPPLATTS